ncbi:nuclear transport factor 2 family protein [Aquabacterium sp. J223]|uniref:nuclear transport factor 2 family protein n=1 Tax=Aquabacterium sp. J223 TaxID=2898431 RepID=UPI0021ADB320|nr:nuclear transport factor 2 family protein [Aquabacterium sp. J223]UUX94517.1 nuclear transport factor 2 family protein [Aquabacterium sp. J223]
MNGHLDPLQRLLAEDACRRLVLDAAAAVDGGRPEAFAALFCEDGVLQRPGGQPLVGRAAIAAAYASRAPDRMTCHIVTNSRVELLGDGEARVASSVLLWTGSRADAEGAQGRPATAQVLGEFDDRLRLTAEGWRFAHRSARFVLYAPTAAAGG